MNFIPKAYAAPQNLGPIEGVGQFQQGAGAGASDLLGSFLSTLVTTLTLVAGLAFILYFVLGGIKWITSSGDKGKAEEARNELTQAAIGLVVVAVSYFIAGIVGGVVGIDILNPAATLGI